MNDNTYKAERALKASIALVDAAEIHAARAMAKKAVIELEEFLRNHVRCVRCGVWTDRVEDANSCPKCGHEASSAFEKMAGQRVVGKAEKPAQAPERLDVTTTVTLERACSCDFCANDRHNARPSIHVPSTLLKASNEKATFVCTCVHCMKHDEIERSSRTEAFDTWGRLLDVREVFHDDCVLRPTHWPEPPAEH